MTANAFHCDRCKDACHPRHPARTSDALPPPSPLSYSMLHQLRPISNRNQGYRSSHAKLHDETCSRDKSTTGPNESPRDHWHSSYLICFPEPDCQSAALLKRSVFNPPPPLSRSRHVPGRRHLRSCNIRRNLQPKRISLFDGACKFAGSGAPPPTFKTVSASPRASFIADAIRGSGYRSTATLMPMPSYWRSSDQLPSAAECSE